MTLVKEPVHGLQKALGLIDRSGALTAQIRLKVGHQQRGRHALAGDVADDQPETVLPEVEEIVVIAAHPARLDACACVLQRAHRRKSLRKEPRLHLHGDLELVGGALLGLLLLGGGATLRFDRAADFVEAHQGERVPIDVLEAREGAAPRGSVLPGCRGHRRWIGCIARPIVDDAPEAWRVSEANAPPPPLGVGGGQILGHEHHLCRAADEPGLGRVGLGLDQRQHC